MVTLSFPGGISHSPGEFVTLEDIDAGLRLLRSTLLLINEEIP